MGRAAAAGRWIAALGALGAATVLVAGAVGHGDPVRPGPISVAAGLASTDEVAPGLHEVAPTRALRTGAGPVTGATTTPIGTPTGGTDPASPPSVPTTADSGSAGALLDPLLDPLLGSTTTTQPGVTPTIPPLGLPLPPPPSTLLPPLGL